MTEPEFDTHGVRDAAMILPVLAVALIVPPLISIFAVPIRLAGIPLTVIYLFGVWAMVVAAAYFLSRRLKPGPNDIDRVSGEPGGP